MNDKIDFRFEVDENGASWKIEIPRAVVLEAVESTDDPIWFKGTFPIPPALCKRYIELLNIIHKSGS